MIRNVGQINCYIKPKADSTLRNMRKDQLIEYIRTLEHNYNVAQSFLEQQAKNISKMQQWIPVTERLPEHGGRIIIHRNGGIVEQGYKDVGDWWKVYGTRTKNVTHWMPMPEPPEYGGTDTNVGSKLQSSYRQYIIKKTKGD